MPFRIRVLENSLTMIRFRLDGSTGHSYYKKAMDEKRMFFILHPVRNNERSQEWLNKNSHVFYKLTKEDSKGTISASTIEKAKSEFLFFPEKRVRIAYVMDSAEKLPVNPPVVFAESEKLATGEIVVDNINNGKMEVKFRLLLPKPSNPFCDLVETKPDRGICLHLCDSCNSDIKCLTNEINYCELSAAELKHNMVGLPTFYKLIKKTDNWPKIGVGEYSKELTFRLSVMSTTGTGKRLPIILSNEFKIKCPVKPYEGEICLELDGGKDKFTYAGRGIGRYLKEEIIDKKSVHFFFLGKKYETEPKFRGLDCSTYVGMMLKQDCRKAIKALPQKPRTTSVTTGRPGEMIGLCGCSGEQYAKNIGAKSVTMERSKIDISESEFITRGIVHITMKSGESEVTLRKNLSEVIQIDGGVKYTVKAKDKILKKEEVNWKAKLVIKSKNDNEFTLKQSKEKEFTLKEGESEDLIWTKEEVDDGTLEEIENAPSEVIKAFFAVEENKNGAFLVYTKGHVMFVLNHTVYEYNCSPGKKEEEQKKPEDNGFKKIDTSAKEWQRTRTRTGTTIKKVTGGYIQKKC